MKATELKPGDIVAYNDTFEDTSGTVISVSGIELSIQLKRAIVTINYVDSGMMLEDMGLRLVMPHSQVLDCVKSAYALVRED